jgi:dolichyl-phosphate-mannose-protein mannosyltransferase
MAGGDFSTVPRVPGVSPRPRPAGTNAPGGWSQLRARIDARDPTLLIPALACIAIAMGVWWRFVALGYPGSFTFDEYHFVENARNYLHGAADWNDHPPLGKLLMLPGLALFGDNGVGWRIHAAVMGTAHIGLVGAVAAGIFSSRRAGWLAAAFVAIDGLFVSYSRTALLDIPMNFFMMAALALMIHARGLHWFAAAAVALGLGVAVKWIAVCLALVVPLLLVRRGRSIFQALLHSLWMGAIAVAVYGGVVAWALVATHQPVSVSGIVSSSRELLSHHAAFTDWKNPADSRWYTWLVLWKPIMLFRINLPGHMSRLTSTVGNPLLWYVTTAALVAATVSVVQAAWQRWQARTPLSPLARRQALVLITAFALLVQWTITNRESYIWHYMGTYSLGLVLLAGMIDLRFADRPQLIGAGLLAAMAVSVFYSPVWTNGLLSWVEVSLRLFLPRWQ